MKKKSNSQYVQMELKMVVSLSLVEPCLGRR